MTDEWILVPKEPTEEMMRAATGIFALPDDIDSFKEIYKRTLAAAPSPWRPIEGAPKDKLLLGIVDGTVRFIRYGKTSHVSIFGWNLADQGSEDFDLCKPTHWMPLPEPPEESE
jgi:hypothetical protein